MTYSIQEQLLNWLISLGFDAYVRVPKNRPSRFVTIERTGGGVTDLVDHPAVAISAWATDESTAEADAIAIRDAALTSQLPAGIYSMRVNSGPYPYFDEDSDMPRYQVWFDVACTL